MEYGFDALLGSKILIKGEAVPADYDQWLQCESCGRIFPLYEIKKESRISEGPEPNTNPFDIGKSIVGLDNKGKLTPIQKERKKQLEIIDREKDPDIKRELKKGLTVEIIEDAMEF